MQHDMQHIVQIQNIDKEEFVSIINNAIESRFQKLKEDSKPQNYSVQDAATMLHSSELTIYNYIRKGYISASKIGRKYIIKREDLEKALKEVKSLRYRR